MCFSSFSSVKSAAGFVHQKNGLEKTLAHVVNQFALDFSIALLQNLNGPISFLPMLILAQKVKVHSLPMGSRAF